MRIFVSYRRTDSAGWTGRLVDGLSERFGMDNVFHDIKIRPGEDFIVKIKHALEKAHYTLVVIGPAWLNVTDERGNRRLDNADDTVRLEVALALQSKSPVIPVLVGGAKMPAQAMLPNDIKMLAQLNAVELSDHRWSKDVHQLKSSLAGKLWWQRIFLVAVGFVQITIMMFWIHQITLQTDIAEYETGSAAIREQYLEKMKVGSDECMAGTWPEGAVKGKTYRENGNMVTDECIGVSFMLDYTGRFFNDEQLWRTQPSSESAARFADTYSEVFGKELGETLTSTSEKPLNATALKLTQKAIDELAAQAHIVVELKQNAGKASERLRTVYKITRLGLYWTIIVGLAILLWFARGALNLPFWGRKYE